MFGILFIYFVGKYFYQLAVEFNRNKWLYAVLGIIVYYAGCAFGGILLGIGAVFAGYDIDENERVLSLLTVPFGIATDYLFYYLLKRKWEKEVVVLKDEIQEIGLPEDN